MANREQQWTYNQYGQVLTHDGPRTDVSDLTTYAYYTDTAFTGATANAVGHTVGDLQRVTNASRQVTNYTKYNKHGQLLESIDPNGVLTINTYDLRQSAAQHQRRRPGHQLRLRPRRPAHTRHPPGRQLDRLRVRRRAPPDGRHDNRGNRIDYTLDNAGNRPAEQVKDPAAP